MSTSDQVADLLTRLRNASRAKHKYVDVKWSKLNQNIVEVLKSKRFVAQYLVRHEEGKSQMRVFLRYLPTRESIIQGLKRISSPGCRKYVGSNEIPRVFNGLGISILSTSKGVLAGSDARKEHVGGELLCQIW